MTAAVVIGLHITKCAGTSLAQAVRQALPPGAWYLCSEFVSNQQQAVLELAERRYLDRLRFVFGHYIHQSLLPLLADRPIALVTGLREPIDRAISEYYHICRVRNRAGQAPLGADEFLAIRRNTICEEILRAFPAGHSVPGELADKAARVLQIFDLIYTSADLDASCGPVLKLLGMPPGPLPRANEREVDTGHEAFMADEAERLREAVPGHFEQDIALYEAVRPLLGQWKGAGGTSWRARWVDRPVGPPLWLKPVFEDADPMLSFQKHQARYAVRNFVGAGRRDDLEALLRQKRSFIDLLNGELGRIGDG